MIVERVRADGPAHRGGTSEGDGSDAMNRAQPLEIGTLPGLTEPD
jgi:hypothetical protein